MARPNKAGLEYFSLDCGMDDKVELIEAKYGLIGFAVIIKLWQKIYSEGYYYKWGEEESLLFCRKINTDINLVNDIIIDSLRWNLFDKRLFEQYGVLTSKGIQKRYINATFKRKGVQISDNLLLVEITDKYKQIEVVKGELTPIKGELTPEKSEEIPQSKVKESKVKNKKIFVENSPEFQLSNLLKSLILANNPGAKVPEDLNNWALEIDRMIRLDKRTPEQIEAVIRFSQQDSFWMANILSTGSLRKQFDKLWLKSKQPGSKQKPPQQSRRVAPVGGRDLNKMIGIE